MRGVRSLILWALLLCVASIGAALDPPELQRRLAARFGIERVVVLNEWLHLLDALPGQEELAILREVNDFVNRNIVFAADTDVWKQADYWATPLETIGQGRGDCEDFSIFKYASLRLAGIAENKLRLVYVKAHLRTPEGEVEQAHMVVAYYAAPDREALVLDNLDPEIRAASKRPDLKPVFSFNGEGVFTGASGRSGGPRSQDRLSRWEDVLRRMHAEGFE